MRILPETGGHGVPPLQLRPHKDRIFEAKLFVLETLLWDPTTCISSGIVGDLLATELLAKVTGRNEPAW